MKFYTSSLSASLWILYSACNVFLPLANTLFKMLIDCKLLFLFILLKISASLVDGKATLGVTGMWLYYCRDEMDWRELIQLL